MSEQSPFSPLNTTEIREFIVNVLGYNKENGYKKVSVSYDATLRHYNVKLVQISRKWLIFNKSRIVKFKHGEDFFSFEQEVNSDKYQTMWMQMLINRAINGNTPKKTYRIPGVSTLKLRVFLQERKLVFLENWCFVRNVKKNASSAEFVTTDIEEANKLIKQGEKLKIIAVAHGFGHSKHAIKIITPLIREIVGVKANDYHETGYLLGKARNEIGKEIIF